MVPSIWLSLPGAPCQNYSEVNAFCDREKQNAKYLLQVGTLIKTINEVQDQEKPLLFMSENVVFRKHDDIMKKYSDITSNGLPPVKIDAQDFSPMVRNRYYWTNMPPDTLEDIDAKYRATPHDLLDEGWSMAAIAYSSSEEMECLPMKANTSMASKGRIDDMRMTKIKETKDGRFIKSSYSVLEREKMMGLPIGYVSKPMKELFHQLAIYGFYFPETEEGTTYKVWLDRSLWHFVKKCQFRVKNKIGESPYFQIELSAPQEGKKSKTFYDEEEYCKRLIGNGWSIVVVEHIMKGIKEMYPSKDFFRQYKGFNYTFPWPPYNECNQQSNSLSEKEQNEKVNGDDADTAITNDCSPNPPESHLHGKTIINNEPSVRQEEENSENNDADDSGDGI